jgi:molybdopterin molybdotransferase
MPDVNVFAKLTSVEDALETILNAVSPVERKSGVELEYADNRVLASDVVAPRDSPHYDQCFRDGYAVVADDTAGCGPDKPAFLTPVDADMVSSGFCKQVHTGSDLPDGADAVVMLEDAVIVDGGVLVLKEAAKGQYYIPKGKAIRKGDVVFKEGRQLKPTDIAMLATLGITKVEVYERPKVLVIPTGDELVERGKMAGPGKMSESNGLMCYLFARRAGGKASLWDIVPDDPEKLREALTAGMKYDLIVTSGGTSVGRRDHMHEIVASMGKVLVHGVGLKPGKPTGMGYIEAGGRRAPIIFLPGVPDACAAGAMVFMSPVIKKLGHYPPGKYPGVSAALSENIATFPGARTIRKVAVRDGKAVPVSTVGPSSYDADYAYAIIGEGGSDMGERIDAVFLE